LTAAERAAVSTYIPNAMTARGVPPLQQLTTISGDTAAFIGDSMMEGVGNTTTLANAVFHNVVLNGTWSTIGDALAGGTVSKTTVPSNSAAAAGTQLMQQFFQPLASRNVFVTMLGTNDDCAINNSAAVFAAAYAKLVRNAKNSGFRVLVSTIPSCQGGGADVSKNAYNALTRQYWKQWGADGLVDIAADPNLGADGDAASAVFFLDTVHWTPTALINDATPIFQRAINRLFGNTDFSTAATYSSAAAAAVLSTAIVEVGNTVTMTLTTPANCQVGSTVVVAGATAGFNSTAANGTYGGWTILTRTAANLTYYDNTTGLGTAGTQATAVSCPQMQDADQYATLNFGVGNFTLESCVGYTGQRVYFQNINAVASTLLPFGSETITGGGATPTTITQLTTAILESELVSASAAGCNWRRIQ
jgi:lysophospholipase L1-like esterase